MLPKTQILPLNSFYTSSVCLRNTQHPLGVGLACMALSGRCANTWTPSPISTIQVLWYPFPPCLPLHIKCSNGLQACWQEFLLFMVAEVPSWHSSAAPTALGAAGALGWKRGLVVLPALQRCLGPKKSVPEEIGMLWRHCKVVAFSTACTVELGWIITALSCLHSPKGNWDLGLQLGLLSLRETIKNT